MVFSQAWDDWMWRVSEGRKFHCFGVQQGWGVWNEKSFMITVEACFVTMWWQFVSWTAERFIHSVHDLSLFHQQHYYLSQFPLPSVCVLRFIIPASVFKLKLFCILHGSIHPGLPAACYAWETVCLFVCFSRTSGIYRWATSDVSIWNGRLTESSALSVH